MKSFKDYEPNSSQNERTEENKAYESAEDLTKRLADAFNGKSSGAMLKEILSEAERSKRAGALTNEEIDAFYEQFSPMLNFAQRSVLKNVVEKLKKL